MLISRFSPLLALSACLFIAAPVFADLAPGPSCPPGSANSGCEGSPYCALPNDCTDTSCSAGERCVMRRVCVDTVECAGDPGAGQDATDPMSKTLERFCTATENDPCCQQRMLCLTRSEEEANPPNPQTGCAVGGASRSGAPSAALLVAFGLLVVGGCRRRR